jgi:hypothetical protein
MSKKRGAYRSRKLETKKRDDRRRRESAIYNDDEKAGWVSLKGQDRPCGKPRSRYIKSYEIDQETELELGKAIEGKSDRFEKYAAARMLVAQAMLKGLIRE